MGDAVGTTELIKDVPTTDDPLSSHGINANDDLDSCVESAVKSEPVHLNAGNEDTESASRFDIVEPQSMVEIPQTEERSEISNEEKRNDVEKLEDSTDVAESSSVMGSNVPVAETGRVNAPSGRSWANMVSQGIGGPAKPSVVAPIMRTSRTTAPPAPVPSPHIEVSEHSSTGSAAEGRGAPKGRESTPNTSLESGNGPVGSTPIEKTKYPDNVQVFVGNIPIAMKSEVLKEFFNNYGEVMDVRINVSKSNGRLPNFGFVIFKAPETVQHVLTKKVSLKVYPFQINNTEIDCLSYSQFLSMAIA